VTSEVYDAGVAASSQLFLREGMRTPLSCHSVKEPVPVFEIYEAVVAL